MPPEDTGQGMPNMTGAPPVQGGGMPPGMPNMGMAPEGMGQPGMGQGGNAVQELEQFIAQLPQEEIDRIIQRADQDLQGLMNEYVQKLLPMVDNDGEAALNLTHEFIQEILTSEMTKQGKTLSELCPNLAQQIGQEEGGGQPEMGQPPQQGMEQPQQSQQPPRPSILGGGM